MRFNERFLGLACGLLLATALHAQDDWTQKFPASSPSARSAHAMASLGGDQVLLFGGSTSGGTSNGETWVYDLSDNTWTQKFPASSPSVRFAHAMAYLGGDQVLLFGGATGPSNGETWVYDLSDNTWTQKFPASSPSARTGHAMAYLGDDQVLLFGGFASGVGLNSETWVYDLSANTWTQKFPASSPSARQVHAMAYLGDDQVLLFGGFASGVGHNSETWVYDLSDNTWTQKFPASSPSARVFHAMAYLGGDQVLLFGGSTGTFNDETWVYDLSDNTWTQKFSASSPSARATHAMADIGSDHVLLFGGDDGVLDDETWVYTRTTANLALNKTATASSSNSSFPPSNANDGNTFTHWRSGSVGSTTVVWWRVDLGATFNINNVKIKWRGIYYAKKYRIQVSLTGSSWTTVYIDNAGNGGIDDVTFATAAARYVRIGMTQNNAGTERINEVEVYAASASALAKASEVAKSEVITDYVLEQNYPNPFNPTTVISFQLPVNSAVKLVIYNSAGQLVRTLVDDERASGRYEVVWDGKNDAGISVATGLYVYVFRAGEFVAKRKLVLMK